MLIAQMSINRIVMISYNLFNTAIILNNNK